MKDVTKIENGERGAIVWERVHSGYPQHNFKMADDKERERSGSPSGRRTLVQTAWTVSKVLRRILPEGSLHQVIFTFL